MKLKNCLIRVVTSRSILLILGFCLIFQRNPVQAQETMDLRLLVDYATKNNLSIRQAQLNAQSASINRKAATMERLPDLSGTVNSGYQFGRTIDPTSNSFITQSVQTSSVGIGTNVLLYNGGRLHHAIQQSKQLELAAQQDVESSARSIALGVAQSYLQLLLTREQLQAAQNRSDIAQSTLDRIKGFIRAGSRPALDSLDFKAQLLRSEQAALVLQQQVDQQILQIKQLIQYPADKELRIEYVDVSRWTLNKVLELDPQAIYQIAIAQDPSLQAGIHRENAAERNIKLAASGYYPALALYANVNSYYSGQAKDFLHPDYSQAVLTLDPPIPAQIDGKDVQVGLYSLNNVQYKDKSLKDQIDDNFGQSIGIGLQIPIFSKNRNRYNVQQARIQKEQVQIGNEQSKQTLYSNIVNAIQSVLSEKQLLTASQASYEAAQSLAQAAEKKMQQGLITNLELQNTRGQLEIAETEFISSKYRMIFAILTIDYYLGKPLSLD